MVHKPSFELHLSDGFDDDTEEARQYGQDDHSILSAGILTPEEFEGKKEQILSRM